MRAPSCRVPLRDLRAAALNRVAFQGVPGAYAEQIAAPVARLVPLPDALSTKQAAVRHEELKLKQPA